MGSVERRKLADGIRKTNFAIGDATKLKNEDYNFDTQHSATFNAEALESKNNS